MWLAPEHLAVFVSHHRHIGLTPTVFWARGVTLLARSEQAPVSRREIFQTKKKISPQPPRTFLSCTGPGQDEHRRARARACVRTCVRSSSYTDILVLSETGQGKIIAAITQGRHDKAGQARPVRQCTQFTPTAVRWMGQCQPRN